jgi:hypothetical protein
MRTSPSGLVAELQRKEKLFPRYTYNKKTQETESWHSDISFSSNENNNTSISTTYQQINRKERVLPGIIYMSASQGKPKDVYYQTLTTKMGEQNQLKLITITTSKDVGNSDYSRLSTFEYPDDNQRNQTVNTISPEAGNQFQDT